jgi:hypothetical protein
MVRADSGGEDHEQDNRHPSAIAKLRRQRNIGDFTNWKDHDEYVKGLERVLRDLSVSAPKSPN